MSSYWEPKGIQILKDNSDYLAFKETTWSYSKFVGAQLFLCKELASLYLCVLSPIQICCTTITNMQMELRYVHFTRKKFGFDKKSLDIAKFYLLFFFVKQNFVKLWRFDFLNIFLGGDSSLAILKILDSQVSLFEQLICTLVCTMWIVGLIDTVVVYLHSIHGSSPNQLLPLASRPTCSFLGNHKDIRHVKSLHIRNKPRATNFLAPWIWKLT